ncbi:hypothetical protein [Nitratidesulfovibrio vulgaris]|uniref:Uncharacterized protein n=1 Tax=Nitratidesulfovibrio vulgaris (strain ATCC 29579 / DSM 644 / CCUG 34227 / NCIMB 8303 / VKM B-1760 / Hildenborough) TaxID=882 RepID=Q72A05_NITV2|nr:hypothetical protein [Nitratidesulfovibrio vulgaris]AAS96665.1 hypothetical protein DVU_2192 [Nitratidesulfovibrio vulgaris str. Hildenborough]ADP87187.1 hypothetical protein Deval_2042 [Nitratidesulfovibrio vulgaris RCH1]
MPDMNYRYDADLHKLVTLVRMGAHTLRLAADTLPALRTLWLQHIRHGFVPA